RYFLRHSVEQVARTDGEGELSTQGFELTVVVCRIHDGGGTQYAHVTIVAERQVGLIGKLVRIEVDVVDVARGQVGAVLTQGPAQAHVGLPAWQRGYSASQVVLIANTLNHWTIRTHLVRVGIQIGAFQ